MKVLVVEHKLDILSVVFSCSSWPDYLCLLTLEKQRGKLNNSGKFEHMHTSDVQFSNIIRRATSTLKSRRISLEMAFSQPTGRSGGTRGS